MNDNVMCKNVLVRIATTIDNGDRKNAALHGKLQNFISVAQSNRVGLSTGKLQVDYVAVKRTASFQ